MLGNIRNHYNGMGGPDKVTIALVVHGPALKAFHTASATPDMTKRTDEMKKSGLQLNACINTMRAQEVTLNDLLPGFVIADKGVRLAECRPTIAAAALSASAVRQPLRLIDHDL